MNLITREYYDAQILSSDFENYNVNLLSLQNARTINVLLSKQELCNRTFLIQVQRLQFLFH
jgi:hypothetical protein